MHRSISLLKSFSLYSTNLFRHISTNNVRLVYVKPNFNELKPIEKNFYKEHPEVTNMSTEEVDSFREKYSIKLTGETILNPVTSFSKINLPDILSKKLSKFNAPTSIQAQTLPLALSGENIVGIAQTGTGKTLAYLLPALVHIANLPRDNKKSSPKALVMAPTRELAQQILDVALDFGLNAKTVCLFGGVSRSGQMNSLRSGVDLCIATPGRLLDFISTNVVNLSDCTYVVLDEADRMLDMGFEPQIRQVLDKIRPDRQILMWSATWPEDIQNLAEEFLEDYTKVMIGDSETLKANPNIKQHFEYLEESDIKMQKVKHILRTDLEQDDKVIVFANTKRTVKWLNNSLKREGFYSTEIHGDKTQAQRDMAISGFKNGSKRVLVATEVAARGLDVSNVKAVINFDMPSVVEDYIHRIGRTGRVDNQGLSFTFIGSEDGSHCKDLVSILKEVKQQVPLFLEDMAQHNYSKKQFKHRGQKNDFYAAAGHRQGFGGHRQGYGGRRQEFGGHREDFGGQRQQYNRRRDDY